MPDKREREEERDHRREREERHEVRGGSKSEHGHSFELDHKGEHWPHDHESGPKHR